MTTQKINDAFLGTGVIICFFTFIFSLIGFGVCGYYSDIRDFCKFIRDVDFYTCIDNFCKGLCHELKDEINLVCNCTQHIIECYSKRHDCINEERSANFCNARLGKIAMYGFITGIVVTIPGCILKCFSVECDCNDVEATVDVDTDNDNNKDEEEQEMTTV